MTGVVGAVIGPIVVFAKHQKKQLDPFSDWSKPVWLGPVVNSKFDDYHPGVSRDGLSLYISSFSPGGVNGNNPNGLAEIWLSQREELDESWGPPQNLGPQINSFGYSSGIPNLTPNGHWLFRGSRRSGGCSAPSPNGNTDIWVARRTQGGEA